jgi:hypothetical protein
MKRFLAFLPACSLVSLLVLGASCDRTSVEDSAGRKLTLKKPVDQTLTRGKTNDLRVEVDRKNIQDPVTLEIDQLPKGVHVVNTDVKIPRDSESVTLTLHADPTADIVSNHRVTVTAKAPPDLQATEVFQVSVKE